MSPKQKKSPAITLEQARAIINAHAEATYAAKRAAMVGFVGRFFKYRNCYSCPSKPSDYWWLYGAATSVDGCGWLKGWTFQRDRDGGVRVEPTASLTNGPESGWEEIDATEFWAAASGILESLTRRLRRVKP